MIFLCSFPLIKCSELSILTFFLFLFLVSINIDGIFGECLFWVLRLTLGMDVYDATTHLGWVKIYSRILRVIIPIVIQYELDNRAAIEEKSSIRFQDMNSQR